MKPERARRGGQRLPRGPLLDLVGAPAGRENQPVGRSPRQMVSPPSRRKLIAVMEGQDLILEILPWGLANVSCRATSALCRMQDRRCCRGFRSVLAWHVLRRVMLRAQITLKTLTLPRRLCNANPQNSYSNNSAKAGCLKFMGSPSSRKSRERCRDGCSTFCFFCASGQLCQSRIMSILGTSGLAGALRWAE
jgi:hypothetical protein